MAHFIAIGHNRYINADTTAEVWVAEQMVGSGKFAVHFKDLQGNVSVSDEVSHTTACKILRNFIEIANTESVYYDDDDEFYNPTIPKLEGRA